MGVSPRIQDVNPSREAQSRREEEVRRIFTRTAESYERVVNLATLGMDKMWKERMIGICRTRLKSPGKILDLACGTGLLTYRLAALYPDSTIVGLDIMPEYLERARSKAGLSNRSRILFRLHNADELESADLKKFGQFDLIITSYLPKYVDVSKLATTCHALLAPHGVLMVHDFVRPRLLFLRMLYAIYWSILSVPLRLSQPWREVGKHLRNIIWRHDWVSEFHTVSSTLTCRQVVTQWQPFQISCIAFLVKGES